jgi:ATP-binding cassette subfamily B protein
MHTERMLQVESQKAENIGATLGRLFKYFKPYLLALLLAALFLGVGTWAQVRAPELIGQGVDCYITPAIMAKDDGGQMAQMMQKFGNDSASQRNCWYDDLPAEATRNDYLAGLGHLILVIVVLYLLVAITTGLMFYAMTWAGQHVIRSLRVDIFNHIHHLSLSYFSKNDAGDVMSRLTNDTSTIQQVIGFGVVQVLSSTVLLVWVVWKMLALNWVYALISVAVLPLMALATWWLSAQARKAFRVTRKEIGNVNAELQENIAAVREVQAFNRETINIEAFEASNAANRDANIKAVSFTSALAPVLEALGYVAVAIVVMVGGLLLLRGKSLGGTVVSLGLIVTFLGYAQRFNQPVRQIAILWTNLQSAIAGSERVFSFLDEESDIIEKPGARVLPPIQGDVIFEDVGAAYNPGEPVLTNINLHARAGETVALVGPTGAGKTTLISLIPRFYDVSQGAIRISGLDVRDVTLASLRSQIGIVLQDTFLFNATVMENIRFGKPSASDEEIMAAAKLSHAHDFIQRLPEGYDTMLGERGAGLSLGQRQLLAIARAVLADPRILILDEATSSVDTRTERLIQAALEKLMANRTTFVVAHRLSTIRNADVVLVLNEGKIIERGSHDELLARKGFYYHLYMSQFRDAEQAHV